MSCFDLTHAPVATAARAAATGLVSMSTLAQVLNPILMRCECVKRRNAESLKPLISKQSSHHTYKMKSKMRYLASGRRGRKNGKNPRWSGANRGKLSPPKCRLPPASMSISVPLPLAVDDVDVHSSAPACCPVAVAVDIAVVYPLACDRSEHRRNEGLGFYS